MFLIVIILLLSNIDLIDSLTLISRGKPVDYCGGNTTDLTDGDRQAGHDYEMNEECGNNFILPLSGGPRVKHMLIFIGSNGVVSTPLHSLDHLSILCDSREMVAFPCAAPLGRINKIKHIENGVRINFYREDIKKITLFFTGVHNTTLSEIEVYARGPGDIIHRGCFANVSSTRSFTFGGFDKCRKECRRSTFGISEPLSSCLCINRINFKNEVSLSECQSPCNDTNKKCGGDDTHSIYIQEYHIPSFIGCRNKEIFYQASIGGRQIHLRIRDVTFSKCVRYCGKNNLMYSYFTNGTHGCFHLQIDEEAQLELSCDIPCVFDEEMTCGGEEGISVYRNCRTDNPIPCDKLFNCKRAIFDHYGVCTQGCKSGFEGEHCMAKVSDPIAGQTDPHDERIELLDATVITRGPTTEATQNVTSQDPMESTDMDISQDPMEPTDMEISQDPMQPTDITLDNSTAKTKKSRSVRVMANFIFAIWVAAAAFY